MSLKYEVHRRYDHSLEYTRHELRHRLDGPADIRESTSLYWFQYGSSHRDDGPSDMCYMPLNGWWGAIEINLDIPEYMLSYFLRGKQYTKEEYESKIRNKIYQ